jgi:hypothetical protein
LDKLFWDAGTTAGSGCGSSSRFPSSIPSLLAVGEIASGGGGDKFLAGRLNCHVINAAATIVNPNNNANLRRTFFCFQDKGMKHGTRISSPALFYFQLDSFIRIQEDNVMSELHSPFLPVLPYDFK